MPNQFVSFLIASVLGSASASALAQPASVPAVKAAPSTTVSPVTVQAAPTPKAIEEQTHTFVQNYAASPNPEIDQIGRWHDPVCVEVVGLPQADQAAVIKARIENVAKAVGLPAARAGCRANIEIVFTDQPQRMMDIVAQRRQQVLGYSHRHETNRLKAVTHPIQAWYITATRGEGAENAPLIFGGLEQYTQRYLNVIDDPDTPPPTACGDSRFTACLKSAFSNVFIVADSKALEGKETGLMADYMVMLALSQPRSLDGCNALQSVIDLLSKSVCPGRDPPNGLTPADAAYLTALYSADLEAKKAGEQSDIAGRMAKILFPANLAAH
jgi:hypothetical protein